ncbi:proline-rich protein 19 [Psammomys obesus]|uniref:proline-rich protein 19 n=1 Tax=Psammomys obesus TaxID=48139 RepID=UPI0024536FE9|nr:proline-rich protein 19 [Psammomys obesus]
MDPRGPLPQPFQQLEKPGRIRRRKTRRERNKALVSSHRQSMRQDGPTSSRDPCMPLQDPVASAASKLVVITQGRLSREHRGLFNHEVKSLDVARLLNSGSLESCSPLLPTTSCCSSVRTQEPALQSRDKENQVPGGSGPGPPNSPVLPVLGQLLEELQCQLILPQAFPRRNLVQEARDTILRTLQGCHGCVPDLALVLQGCQPPLPETKPRVPERQRTVPCSGGPEHAPREERPRTRQATKGHDFAVPQMCSSTSPHKDSQVPPADRQLPFLSSTSSPSGAAWGPPTAFDMLKSIWLIATPPAPQPWDMCPAQSLPQPPSPLLPRTSALDWSPNPPAPLPSLSWVVTQSSPEAWSFPPMRLY